MTGCLQPVVRRPIEGSPHCSSATPDAPLTPKTSPPDAKASSPWAATAERVYFDHGLTGTNRDRPGLREALAACRAGYTLVVTKLDRLARSLPDARVSQTNSPPGRSASASAGRSPTRPTLSAGCCFNVLAMVAESEADLIRLRTREGMKVAKAKGHLRGKQPKLGRRQEAHLVARRCRRVQHRRGG